MSSNLPELFQITPLFHITPKQPFFGDENIIVSFLAVGGYFSSTSKYLLPKYCEDDYVVIRSYNENTSASMYRYYEQGLIRIYISPRPPIQQTDN